MGFINLGSIGKAITKTLPKLILPVAGTVLLGAVGKTAIDIFKQVAGGLTNKTGTGGLFSDSIPVNLPNPLSKLNGLLGGIGRGFNGVGDFLNNIGDFLTGNRNIGGQQVFVPQLADRGYGIGQASNAIGAAIGSGAYPIPGYPNGYPGTGINPGGVYGPVGANNYGAVNGALANAGINQSNGLFDAGLSPEQRALLEKGRAGGMDSKELMGMQLQMDMQNQKRLAELISNLLKMMHDTQSSIIGNIR